MRHTNKGGDTLNTIYQRIQQYKDGLLTLTELNRLLHSDDPGLQAIRGSYNPANTTYTGYDYERQAWVRLIVE